MDTTEQLTEKILLLQWGRGLVLAEIGRVGEQVDLVEVLQWGRGLALAEMRGKLSPSAAARMPQ